MSLSAIQQGERFTGAETEHIQRCFQRDGYYEFGPLLDRRFESDCRHTYFDFFDLTTEVVPLYSSV